MDKRNNSGNRNSGHCNSGDYNSGDYNSGNRNSGDYNSGNRNSGNRNSGDFNSGDFNSGDCTSGDCNSGNRNSGDYNSGNYNSGNRNSGHYNSGDCNSGHFCTETPKPMFFDRPVDMTWEEAIATVPIIDLPVGCRWVNSDEMTDEEKAANPNHTALGGYLKMLEKDFRVAFPQWWQRAKPAERQQFLDLPNFDAEKFLKITGVDVRELESKEKKVVPSEVVIDGRRYVLAEGATP